jgi:hypothetical protein
MRGNDVYVGKRATALMPRCKQTRRERIRGLIRKIMRGDKVCQCCYTLNEVEEAMRRIEGV